MLNTGESPNVAVESHLSQILEDNVPEKYYLSPKACLGILRRAENRCKPLPNVLQQALVQQMFLQNKRMDSPVENKIHLLLIQPAVMSSKISESSLRYV